MATQKGRNWSSGDIVTAADLGSIEQGVSAVAEEYTPTTWANGDTVTAAALNNIEQGIANAGGGGSWTVLTDESVTTHTGIGSTVLGDLAYSEIITADTIKVTFNGTEYTCTKTAEGSENYYGAEWSEEGYDFSTYPFAIESRDDHSNYLLTETAGTYSIKIEAPQSGGSSDFSTAEVTVVNGGSSRSLVGANALDDGEDTGSVGSIGVGEDETKVVHVILYKGVAWVSRGDATIISVSGSAEKLGSSMVMVTGDCTITISDSSDK